MIGSYSVFTVHWTDLVSKILEASEIRRQAVKDKQFDKDETSTLNLNDVTILEVTEDTETGSYVWLMIYDFSSVIIILFHLFI